VPLVVREAVGDRDPGPHESALFDLQAKYAEVVDEDKVVSWLELPSGHIPHRCLGWKNV
jgi:maleamate amidohydrolase